MKDTLVFVPERCEHCEPLPRSQDAGPNDPPPTRHQVAELPALTAEITEYQGHADLPLLPWKSHVPPFPPRFGLKKRPRLTATLSYLSGVHKVSRRRRRGNRRRRVRRADCPGHGVELEEQVKRGLEGLARRGHGRSAATVKNVDETS
ncbi:MAG: hypothetical protein U0793_11200 [Gemmataceae bacterium]